MNYTIPFTELSKKDTDKAGGKGASLGEMTQVGISVPPGFVVSAQTFEHFIKETDLIQEIDAILDTVNHNVVHTVEEASQKIQGLILNADMPDVIKSEIESSFKESNTEFVAVRSSATAEDGLDHAWAGQLDSYLNVTTNDVVSYVQKCWASLFTPRAIFYRFEKELNTTHISVAVVVQKMVNSQISGIAFSVHPVTENRNQLIIEAGFGLGEAIVSGQITPDSYVVEKEEKNILDINVNTQNKALYRKEGGGNAWKEFDEEEGSKQVLTEPQILELSELIKKIESHYNVPQDIEWAMEGGEFYIVQSRPITTLSMGEIVTENSATFISPELQDFDVNGYDFDGLWKNDLFATCFWQDCWIPGVAKRFKLNMNGVGVINLKGGHFLVNKSVRQDLNKQITEKIENKDKEFFGSLVIESDKIFEWGLQKGDDISAKEPTVEHFKEFVEVAKEINFTWLIGATYLNWPTEAKLQEAVLKEGIPAEHALDVVPKIITPQYEYHHGLKDLKKEIGKRTLDEVKEDKELYKKLEVYVEKYKWVATINFIGDLLTIESLYSQIQDIDLENQSEVYVHSTELSEEFKFIAQCLHDAGYVKQAGAEYFSMFSIKVRPFLQSVAEKIGITYRELMCLSTFEIEQALRGELNTEDLKKKYQERVGVNDWAVIGDKDGKTIFIEEPKDIVQLMEKLIPSAKNANEINGQVGNKGKYIGTVRVIMNTYDFDKMQDGDVLVTTMTTPDFILLMQKAGAIVTDIGGLLSHAAIVSRELNTPCVIGTKFGTQIFKDGDEVEVDADNGVVKIVNKKTTNSLKLNKESYTRLFEWADYIPYSLSYDFVKAYKDIDGLAFSTHEKWASYMSDVAVARTNDAGLGLYGSIKKYEESKELLYASYENARELSESIMDSEILDKDKIEKYFEIINEYRINYSKTEFFYTDLVYKKQEDYPDFKKNYETFEQFKIDGRTNLNKLFFEPDAQYTKVLKKISELTNVNFDDIYNYSSDEVVELVATNKTVDAEIIQRRKEAHVVYATDSIIYEFDGEKAQEIIDHFDVVNTSTDLKGVTASPGSAIGNAYLFKISMNNHDEIPQMIEEMEDGNILIAETTEPRIISACNKAGAIVTNQGGMMSHAAIVARELGIPCIVGTADATDLIKMGDEVEVDADNGVVRILNKNEPAESIETKEAKDESEENQLGGEFYYDSYIKDEILEKNADFYKIPVIHFEHSFFSILKSPYFKKIPKSIALLDDNKFSFWVEKVEENFITQKEDIEDFVEYINQIEIKIDVEAGFLLEQEITDNSEAIKQLDEYNKLLRETYRLFSVFTEELIKTEDQELQKKLQDLRLRISEGIVSKIWKGQENILSYVEQKYDLLRDVIDMLHTNDLKELLTSENTEAFKDKKEKVILYLTEDDLVFREKEEFDYALKKLEEQNPDMSLIESTKTTKEILGQVGNTGTVRGEVVILKTEDYKIAQSDDLEKYKGKILVTGMTRPEFMPILKDAKAFVTDEGGITCHAAIVSRELGIPCVIGTKVATQVLKDGDEVEVDADNGVVKLITD